MVDAGKWFQGYKGHDHKLPHYVRNGHLGYHGARNHPLYFEKNQLFDMVKDPEETENIYNENTKLTKKYQDWMLEKLKSFPNRPFGGYIEMMNDF